MSGNTESFQEAPSAPSQPGISLEAGASIRQETSSVSADKADRAVPGRESSPSATRASTESLRFFCDLCKVECSSQQHLQSHVDGKAHKRRLIIVNSDKIAEDLEANSNGYSEDPFAAETCIEKVAENIWRCVPCDVRMIDRTCIVWHLESHETGLKPYKCELCNVQCQSEKSFQDHVDGKKHKRIQGRMEQDEQLEKDLNVIEEGLKNFGLSCWRCTPCFIALGHPSSVRSHIISERHKKAVHRHEHATA